MPRIKGALLNALRVMQAHQLTMLCFADYRTFWVGRPVTPGDWYDIRAQAKFCAAIHFEYHRRGSCAVQYLVVDPALLDQFTTRTDAEVEALVIN
ncbi:hypothetical protein [Lacticaseibacillus daqingensis]|uniref:hypothetical protein n=1 Tax=Lacticaseibacillus daqingensis TaxID=2486014 RepID=UPI000F76CDAD|nr:hypothetical protein [Lacticaseibacillus daqingensis]